MKKSEILRAFASQNKLQFKNKIRNLQELSPSEHVANRSFETTTRLPANVHLGPDIARFNFLYLQFEYTEVTQANIVSISYA